MAFVFAKRKRCFLLLLIVLVSTLFYGASPALAAGNSTADNTAADNAPVVYIAEISNDFTETSLDYLQRVLQAARTDGARYIIVKIDAVCEYSDYLKQASDLLLTAPQQTICYVHDEAAGGAALLALSCDTVIMSPGAVLDAAQGEGKISRAAFDSDYWLETFSKAAAITGHNQKAAQNLVLSLKAEEHDSAAASGTEVSAVEAINCGLADGSATSMQVIFDEYQLQNGVIIQLEKNFKERLLDVLASPAVLTLLLTAGFGFLLAVFIFSDGGAMGVLSALCLLMYFLFGYYLAAVPLYAFILMVPALALLLTELLLSPGSGICGVCGAVLFIVSVVLTASDSVVALIQIIIVVIVAVILIMSNKGNEKSRNILRRLVLRDRTTTDEGYLSQPVNIRDYVGMEGIALTSLRPAGAVKIGAERVDVVTEGDFIAAGDRVKVIKVDGSSVIVRSLK